MERKPPDVKPRRPYDATRRRQQARETREAILDVARSRFLTDGYAPTTIASIADDVGVSVDTIYKSFGGKPGLVRAICERALAGGGPVHAETRSDALQASEPDPRAIIRGFGSLSVEVAPRVAPILLLIRDAAAADPEMADLQREMNTQRLDRMTANASNLAAAGYLRDDVTVERAAEIMWTYSSPELFQLLVLIRAWPLERYGAFIADAMIAALLPTQ
jgi:AcrR family transcriptional regulator